MNINQETNENNGAIATQVTTLEQRTIAFTQRGRYEARYRYLDRSYRIGLLRFNRGRYSIRTREGDLEVVIINNRFFVKLGRAGRHTILSEVKLRVRTLTTLRVETTGSNRIRID